MNEINQVNKLKKIIKIMVITITVFILLILFLCSFILWMMWSDANYSTVLSFESLMEQALRVPFSSSTMPIDGKIQDHTIVKDDWLDLEPISYEEWMSFECSYPPFKGSDYTHKKLTKEEYKHMECIKPGIFPLHSYRYKSMSDYFHIDNTSMLKAQCLKINVHEYVLKYPKVLNNMIKIAEKPCHYLKKKNIHWDRLYCDKLTIGPFMKEQSYSIINIIDSQGHYKVQIRIPRTDNAHLIKNNNNLNK